MCIEFTTAATTGALAAWAQCWFMALMMLVIVTIAVLFILALLVLARL